MQSIRTLFPPDGRHRPTPALRSDSGLARPLVIAHRGASHAFAEHTRAAYLQALADGADGVECDVHLTRDRQLVLWHDPTLERTSDGSGRVSDHTLAQLRGLDVHSWHPGRLPSEYGGSDRQLLTLPELVELLVDAGRPIRLAVEFKHPSPFGHELEERALTWLIGAGWDPETSRIGQVQVSFMSFYAGSLQYLTPTVPSEMLCALVELVPAGPVPSRLAWGPLSRAAVRATLRQAAADSERIIWDGRAGMAGPGLAYVRGHLADVKAWLAAGRRLRVWTADHPEDVELLAGLGVHEITTNRPEAVLGQISEMFPG